MLFPGVLLPLHILEPGYRAMIADTLEGDRRRMVLLRPGWETDYEGRPPIFPVGCTDQAAAERIVLSAQKIESPTSDDRLTNG